MYKHNRGMLPEIFNDMINLNVSPHSYNTRQGATYKIPYCYTKIRQNTQAYTGSKYWNTIVSFPLSSLIYAMYHVYMNCIIMKTINHYHYHYY